MNKVNKRIGITGSGGFIGSYLEHHLPNSLKDFAEGVYSLRCHYRKPPLKSTPNPDGMERTYGDLSEENTLIKFIPRLQVLVHLANSNFPRDTDTELTEDIQRNLLNTVNLFERFAAMNPNGHIVYFSSGGAVYDPNLPPLPRKESDPVRPISNYGIQKLAAEQFLVRICKETGIAATILRVSNPYGTLLTRARAQGIIGVAMSCLREDAPFRLFGSASTVRDYLHLEDVARATAAVLENPPLSGHANTYNVGSGKGIRTDDLLKLVETAAGKKLEIIVTESGAVEPIWNVLGTEKIRKELGWTPKIELLDGLKQAFFQLDAKRQA